MAEPTKIEDAKKKVNESAVKTAQASKKVEALKAEKVTKSAVKSQKNESKPPKDSHL
jgi:hypothetical protein